MLLGKTDKIIIEPINCKEFSEYAFRQAQCDILSFN